MNAEMEQSLENCLECHRICEETTAYSVRMGGEHAGAIYLRLLRDCAQICVTSADLMLRGIDGSIQTSRLRVLKNQKEINSDKCILYSHETDSFH